jgi:3-methyladenine DNA glycosylase Tag
MTPFAEIEEEALSRHGQAALDARLARPRTADELRHLPEAYYLSQISLRTFRAGLRHELVDRKWPAFEEVFDGFDPDRCANTPDERIEELLGDRRLIRNLPKLRAVRANAGAVVALRSEGGIGAWLADWPGSRVMPLWDELARRFQQMGGNSAPYFLRMVGKDSFMLTDSVLRGLVHWGVLTDLPPRKADRAQIQQAFNDWAAETGRPLCQLSQILALSLDT